MKKVKIPKEDGLDNSLDVLFEGYRYMPDRMRQFHSDIYETRLVGGQKVICISGEEAANVFYDGDRFERRSAIPKRIQKSLFGKNGVQMLDGAPHRHRKQMFMSLMTQERLQKLNTFANEQWAVAIPKWERMNKVILFDETERLMCRIACQWAGVPLWAREWHRRASDLGKLIDAFGAAGPRHWQGRMARKRTEKWVKAIIQKVRAGNMTPSDDTPLHTISWYRDLHGKRLPLQVAAVELINILRPIVAIARYITFGALALHRYPEERMKLRHDPEQYSQWFVQEIRRFYPFTPFLGARVRRAFTWKGHRFKKGRLVLLDIYGANHSPKSWKYPDKFDPERFKGWRGTPFGFIPQGGGEYEMGHRCGGEGVTIELMKTSLHVLANQIDYDVPEQDLHVSMTRMPTLPKSRFQICHVKAGG